MCQPSNEMIELTAQNEETISRLYTEYARKLPIYAAMWNKLADEEKDHAHWLRRLEVRIKDGSGHINENCFDVDFIRGSLDSLNKLITETINSDIDIMTALKTALRIEESVLEKRYFEVFESDSAEISQVKLYLEQATQDHAERLKKTLAEIK